MTFSVYGPADTDCSTPLKTAAVPLQNGHATSANFLAQQAGEYRWTAEYEGDAQQRSGRLGCGAANQTSTVGKASPTLARGGDLGRQSRSADHRQRDPCRRLRGRRPARLPRLRPRRSDLRRHRQVRSDGAVNGNGSYSPAGFRPGGGPVSVDGRIRGRRQQRSGRPGLRRHQPGLGGGHGCRDHGGQRHRRHGREPGDRHGVDPGRSDSGRTDHVQGLLARRRELLRRRSLQLDGQRRGERLRTARPRSCLLGSARSAGPSATRATRTTPRRRPTAARRRRASLRQGPRSPARSSNDRPVGTSFQDTATLQGGYAPAGTITFRIYGPVAAGCAKPTGRRHRPGRRERHVPARIRSSRSAPVATASWPATRVTPRTTAATEPCDSVRPSGPGAEANAESEAACASDKRQADLDSRAPLGRGLSLRHDQLSPLPPGRQALQAQARVQRRHHGQGRMAATRWPSTSRPNRASTASASATPATERNRRYKRSCSGAQADPRRLIPNPWRDRGGQARSRGWSLLGREELVDELDRDRALADRGGDAVHRPVTDVSRGEDAGHAGLERERAALSSGQLPSLSRSVPVRMNPPSPRASSAGSQSVFGWAPIIRKSSSASTVSVAPSARERRTRRSSQPSPPPPPPTTSVPRRTSMLGVPSTCLTR